MDESTKYKIYKLIEANPEINQREISKELGVSLGKVNYCLKSLITKGVVKTRSFCNNKNKASYLYILTPKGIEDKAWVTVQYLKRKMAEYDNLREEIAALKLEIDREGRLKKMKYKKIWPTKYAKHAKGFF